MRQPDIEIYLKDADVDHKAIATWLGAALGPCSDWVQKGQTYKCKAGNVPVTWLPKRSASGTACTWKATRPHGTTTSPAPALHLPR